MSDTAEVRQAIRNDEPDLLDDAEDADVDVDSVIENVIDGQDFPTSVLSNLAEGKLRSAIESSQAEEVEGLLLGCRDAYGRNFPRQFSLVRSTEPNIEISSFEGSTQTPDGSEVDIPIHPVKATLGVQYDQQYDSWSLSDLRDTAEITHTDLVSALSSVAIDPGDVTGADADDYAVVVVKGEIAFADNLPEFDDDGNLVGDKPVMMQDASGEFHPTLELSFDRADDGTSLTGALQRQKNGSPFIAVEGLEQLCTAAVENKSDPGAQAQFVGQGIRGTEVIMVGAVTRYESDRDGDGDPVQYVTMAPTAVIQTEPFEDVPGGSADETADEEQETLPSEDDGEPDEDGTPVEDVDGVGDAKGENLRDAGYGTVEAVVDASPSALAEVDGIGEALAADIYAAAGGEDGEDGEDDSQVADVRSDIETYCELTGEDIEGLTVDDVNESIQGVEAADSVIQAALDGRTDAEDEDGGGESTQLEDLLYDDETGLYHCPGDGCPGKASSVDELARNHVAEEHDTESRSPPQWLAKEA